MKELKKCGIYKITSPTGKIYIGESTNIYDRYLKYRRGACKDQPKIYNSLSKYGFVQHIFEIIEECNKEDLNTRERYWQEFYNVTGKNGLNCSLTKTYDLKMTHSDETRLKMSENNKGENNPFYGKTHSEEAKKRIGESGKGRRFKRIKGSFKGKTHTEEAKNKISEARKKHDKNKVSPRSKLVICLETGIFYTSLKEAANAHGIKYKLLSSYLGNNKRNNKTNLIYV